MSDRPDVIVIGSGPAGAHASYPLVAAGLRVAMIDGGRKPDASAAGDPAIGFEEMRRTRADQAKWFLGEDYTGIPLDAMGAGIRGSILSGRRSHITRAADEHLPVTADGVRLFQSLSRGGLGAAWGGVCAYYTPMELESMGLPAREMTRHYSVITERIGVSGPPGPDGVQPPFQPDHHAALLLEAYQRNRRAFDALDVSLSQPYSAVLTRDLGSRRAAAYRDMEYWLDPDRTVYRPEFTLEELERHPNFSYVGGRVVERVEHRSTECLVHSAPVSAEGADVPPALAARLVIVAAGAVGTARILLRSLGLYDTRVPLLAKPHWLTACLHPRTLGQAGRRERLSLCQLLLSDTRASSGGRSTAGYAQIYSYKSLGLVRMLGFVPAPAPEALDLLGALVPSFVIADMRVPVERRASRFLTLCRASEGRDRVHLQASPDPEEFAGSQDSLQRLTKALRKLGLLPLKRKALPHGAAAHYAGTVPFAADSSTDALSVDEHCRLRQAGRVYVADSSVFRFMPAKSINLTIMANANRVGERVRDVLLAGDD